MLERILARVGRMGQYGCECGMASERHRDEVPSRALDMVPSSSASQSERFEPLMELAREEEKGAKMREEACRDLRPCMTLLRESDDALLEPLALRDRATARRNRNEYPFRFGSDWKQEWVELLDLCLNRGCGRSIRRKPRKMLSKTTTVTR